MANRNRQNRRQTPAPQAPPEATVPADGGLIVLGPVEPVISAPVTARPLHTEVPMPAPRISMDAALAKLQQPDISGQPSPLTPLPGAFTHWLRWVQSQPVSRPTSTTYTDFVRTTGKQPVHD